MLIRLKAIGFSGADLDSYLPYPVSGAMPSFDLFLVMETRPENEIEQNYDGPAFPGYRPDGQGSGRKPGESIYFYRRVSSDAG